MKKAIGVVVGILVGGIAMSIVHLFSSLLYPMPEGVSPTDVESLHKWIRTLPTIAFLLAILGHGLGALVGALVCRLIVGHRWIAGTLIITGLFLLGGIFNSLTIPQPFWVSALD